MVVGSTPAPTSATNPAPAQAKIAQLPGSLQCWPGQRGLGMPIMRSELTAIQIQSTLWWLLLVYILGKIIGKCYGKGFLNIRICLLIY